MEVPVYNNAQDDVFPRSFLLCGNVDCSRHGLLTVVFKNYEEEEENKEDGNEEVQSESVS